MYMCDNGSAGLSECSGKVVQGALGLGSLVHECTNLSTLLLSLSWYGKSCACGILLCGKELHVTA